MTRASKRRQLGDRCGLGFLVERGQWADYLRLARHHYRARRPATVDSVWRLTARPVGATADSLLWRSGAYPATAGVLVVSFPTLCSAARNAALGRRYCTWPDRRVGIGRLNREVRTISRVIIHPLYRGLGLASELVGQVVGRLDVPVVEAFARMGRFVPFFRSAGMTELSLPGRPTYFYIHVDLRLDNRKGDGT